MAYYDKLKNKIRPEDALPEGYGFDDMKEGIYSKMPAKKEKRRRHFLFWWLTPIVGLLSAGLVYYFSQLDTQGSYQVDSRSSRRIDKSEIINQNSNQQSFVTKTNIEKRKDVANKSINSTTLLLKTKSNNYRIQSPLSSEKIKHSKNTIQSINYTQNDARINTKSHNDDFQNSPIEKAYLTISPNHSIVTEQSSINTDINTAIKDSSITLAQRSLASSKINDLSINTLPNLFISPKIENELPTLKQDNSIIPLKVKQTKNWSVEFGTGIFTWQSKNLTRDSIDPSTNVYTSSLTPNYGYNIYILSHLQLMNGWYLSAGIDGVVSKSYLTYEASTSKQIKLDNQVVKIEQNLLTGSVNQVLGTANASVYEIHKLRKNNTDLIIKIPILIGYSVMCRKWSFHGGVGISTNLWSRHHGVTIVNSQIINYNGSHPLWQPVFQFNLESQIKAKYQFNQQVSLGAILQYSKALQDHTVAEKIIMKPNQIGISALIGYRF